MVWELRIPGACACCHAKGCAGARSQNAPLLASWQAFARKNYNDYTDFSKAMMTWWKTHEERKLMAEQTKVLTDPRLTDAQRKWVLTSTDEVSTPIPDMIKRGTIQYVLLGGREWKGVASVWEALGGQSLRIYRPASVYPPPQPFPSLPRATPLSETRLRVVSPTVGTMGFGDSVWFSMKIKFLL